MPAFPRETGVETICRFELHHDSVAGHDALLERLSDGFPWGGAATIQRLPETDGSSSVIYVAPEGESLPDQPT